MLLPPAADLEGWSTKTTRLFEAIWKSRRNPRPGDHRFIFRGGEFFVVRREAVVLLEILVERLRPARKLDRFCSLIVRQIRVETEPMPKFLGDKGQEGMKQTQRMAKNEIDHSAAYCALRGYCRFSRESETRFARLQIPIAIFAPEKPIKRLRRFAEIVFLERPGDRADGCIETQQNPFVVAASGAPD